MLTACPPPPLQLCLCLDAELLRHLRVRAGEESQLLLDADELRAVVEQANPTICDRPVVSEYLRQRSGKLVGLVQENPAYVYRLVAE